MAALETVVVSTSDTTTRSVIWLHGLGADGHDFEPVVPELGLNPDPGVRFIFPHAPVRSVTLNNGMAMRAWFDIYGLDRSGPFDEDGIAASVAQVEQLIRAELADGRSAGDIVLAGFSQGGVIALHTALRYPARLAGVMALSTYLPLHETLLGEAASANADLPVFMAHGMTDPVLSLDLGEHAQSALSDAGYPVEWRVYPMAHQVCMEQLRHIGAWLNARFA